MSIAKGIVKTAENVVKMNADTMQIFSRNPRGSNYKDPTVKEAEEFQRIRREAGFGAILAHAPYTMNLASAKPEVYEFACTVIREDVARMDRMGIENLVFHPGSHTGIGAEAGIQTQVRKYDKTISSLKSDKATLQKQKQDLTRQVKEATTNSIRKKMDDARLRADYEKLQKLVNRIPPEILELAKRGQLNHSNRER